MRIVGNDQKNNENIWGKILERIIGKISSIIGASIMMDFHKLSQNLNDHDRFCLVAFVSYCIPIYCISHVLIKGYNSSKQCAVLMSLTICHSFTLEL